jgi:hypothetical protein
MQMRENDYLETKALTVSFKWEKEDSFIQHDVQEFSKVLFEALEMSFAATDAYDTVDQLFQGESLTYNRCKNAGCESSNLEKWLDLQMVIENPYEKAVLTSCRSQVTSWKSLCRHTSSQRDLRKKINMNVPHAGKKSTLTEESSSLSCPKYCR